MKIRVFLSILTILVISLNIGAQDDFILSQQNGCVPFKVKISVNTDSVDLSSVDSILWDFGDKVLVDTVNPDSMEYTRPGVYIVKMFVNGDSSRVVTKRIDAHRALNAAFNYRRLNKDSYDYSLTPIDSIRDDRVTYTYRWEISNNSGYSLFTAKIADVNNTENRILEHTFPERDRYSIKLTIRDNVGCIDSVRRRIVVTDTMLLANVFAPASMRNYVINSHDPSVVFHFQLCARSGVKVYDGKGSIIYWDGRDNNGNLLSTGVYFYKLDVIEGESLYDFKDKGFIHLFTN